MFLSLRLPKTLLWVFNLLVIFLLLFTGYRILTLIAFKPEGEKLDDLFSAFILGLRFDLRWISIVLMPIVIASLIPALSPFACSRNKKVWTWYLAVMSFLVIFFFAADFGCFSYNKTRLNASALNFAEDPGISAAMLWESYHILWMLFGLLLAVFVLRFLFRKMHGSVVSKTDGKGIQYKRGWFIVSIFFFAFLIYGSIGSPLKWKAAFNYNDSFKSYLALNPLQNFFTTLKFRTPQYDEAKAREYFGVMKNWMGLSNNNFSYKRVVSPNADALKTKPNVVLVMCESFSMYKSSMSGNPLNTTPYFNSLCNQGVFFDHCFTPHFSTARGLFAILTGIPDVQLSKFSTRNPEALDQHTIINNFKDYQKFYFLGGDPGFNNFQGLVNNVEGIQMMTGTDFQKQPVNVWGISDKDLFSEANQFFAKQNQPFFAIIQTADNHRPFTIPENDSDFQKQELPKDSLEKYGFESVEEYNSFRYSDYCFEKFIEAAKKENYFNNTIFVFVGDHGVDGNAKNIYPTIWTDERLTDVHVPLLFYAPKLLPPKKHQEVVSQIDLLPSIAGLTGQTYTNTTLGTDIFHNKNGNHAAFIIHHDEGKISLMTDEFYFSKNLNFQNEELKFLKNSSYSPHQIDSIKRKFSVLTTAYYETAKWMLVHNKK